MEGQSDVGTKTDAPDRRGFLGGLAGAAGAAVLAGSAAAPRTVEARGFDPRHLFHTYRERLGEAVRLRSRLAFELYRRGLVPHPHNGDEDRYPDRSGSFHKALPHNANGEVEPEAYRAYLRAIHCGAFDAFERIPKGGDRGLVSPLAGLAYNLEGPDVSQFTMRPAPALAGAEAAGEMVEVYWMACLRDVPFTAYGSDPGVAAACDDLSALSDFRGPKVGGDVTPATLFRGDNPGDLNGPYVSQFLLRDFIMGSVPISGRQRTVAAGLDYGTTFPSYLSIQNGVNPGPAVYDATPRYIRNGRDLAEWVHNDALFQSAFFAALFLLGLGAPFAPGLPYVSARMQEGFATFGGAHLFALLGQASGLALKAAWFQKWYVHRRLRPEAFGGLVHLTLAGTKEYPVHEEVLESGAVARIYDKFGTWLMPLVFPEGSPTHPAYPAGHSTFVGTAVTVCKAFFDESWMIPDPVVPNADGTALVPYSGPPMTVGGELNKLASNIAQGRNFAGIHYRTDATEGFKLGEELVIALLQEWKHTWKEPVRFRFTRFDGRRVEI